MKFDFPKDKKTETLNISIYLSDINKVRAIAKKYNCTINDVYKTLISESLEEYEKLHGKVVGEQAKSQYSHKRDVYEAGDNLRKEVEKVNPDATFFESVDIVKPKPTTLEEKLEQDAKYQREYYAKNKDKLVVKKKEHRAVAPEEVKAKEAETKHQYYLDHPEKFHKDRQEKTHNLSYQARIDNSQMKEDMKIKGSLRTCSFIGCKLSGGRYIESESSQQVSIKKETYYFCSEYCMKGFIDPHGRTDSWSIPSN